MWWQDASCAAELRARLPRRAWRWALEAVVCQHPTVARVAEAHYSGPAAPDPNYSLDPDEPFNWPG